MSRTKSLTKMTIMFMIFAIVFSFRNIANNQAQFGIFAVILFLVGGIIYAIPLALVSSEFGSIKGLENLESGIGSFTKKAFGEKGGFMASGASFFANMFFFATIAPFTIIAISFVFLGRNGFDGLAEVLSKDGIADQYAAMTSGVLLSIFAIILFGAATYIARRGPSGIGKVTNIGGTGSLVLGGLAIVIALFVTIPLGTIHGDISGDWNQFNPSDNGSSAGTNAKDGGGSFLGVVPGVVFSYNGIETISVFIKDTKGGIKEFKKGALIGIIIVIAIMVISAFVIGIAFGMNNDPKIKEIFENNLSNSYFQLFPALFGLKEGSIGYAIVIRLIALVGAVNGFGALLFGTVAPAKVFFSELPEGSMGKGIEKTDNNGIPQNALKAQGVTITILLLIVGLTTLQMDKVNYSASSSFLTTITQTTTTLAIFPIMLMYIGYLKIKFKHPDGERSITIVKNKWAALVLLTPALTLLTIAGFFGSIPAPSVGENDLSTALTTFMLTTGGFLLFMGFAVVMGGLNKENGKEKIKSSLQKVLPSRQA